MKLTILVLLLASVLLASALSFNPDAAAIEELFDAELGTEKMLMEKGITSIVVSVVYDKQKIFSKGYGYANPITKTPVSPSQSQYNIGSITKTFTGVTALQQVEKSVLNLDTNVNTYTSTPIVHDTIIGDSLGDSYSGSPVSTTSTDVTLRNLLTHTSGFDERLLGLSARSYADKKSLSDYLQSDMPPRIRKPNIVSTYSNHGLTLAGLVVQDKVKQQFGDILKQRIFTPCGMQNTFYEFPSDAKNITSNPFYPSPMLRTSGTTSYTSISNFGQYMQTGPAGAIWSTADDMANYALMHLNYGTNPLNGEEVLASQTAKQMYAQQYTARAGVLGYGLVWFQQLSGSDTSNISYIEHGGALPPYHSLLSLYHDAKAGLFLSMVGTSPEQLSALKFKFMKLTMKNDTAKCTGETQEYSAASGQCIDSIPVASIKPIEGYETRFSSYEGCYGSFRYEHTTWFKLATIFSVPFCFVKSGSYLKSISPTQDIVLWEVEPNLFKLGKLANEKVYYSITKYSTATFVADNSTGRAAGYLVIDQIPLEYANKSIGWNVVFQLSFSLLVVLFCCCCCCCTLTFALFDVRAYIKICKARKTNKEAQQISTTLSFDDDEENMDQEHRSLANYENATSSVKREYIKSKNVSKVLLAAVIASTIFTIIGILLSTVLNIIHFVSVLVQLTIVIPATDSFLFEQKSRGALGLALNLPILSIIALAVMCLSCIGSIIVRFLKRKQISMIYTVLLALSVLPVLALNITYMVATGYYNIFSSAFLH